jgi:hypothetical protein
VYGSTVSSFGENSCEIPGENGPDSELGGALRGLAMEPVCQEFLSCHVIVGFPTLSCDDYQIALMSSDVTRIFYVMF